MGTIARKFGEASPSPDVMLTYPCGMAFNRHGFAFEKCLSDKTITDADPLLDKLLSLEGITTGKLEITCLLLLPPAGTNFLVVR